MKLELNHLTKRYGEQAVLNQITADLDFPHVLALLGPSGGGKSTLLRVIGGLETPEQGYVRVDGQEVPRDEKPLRLYRSQIGTVFQSWNLFPHMDALANVMLPLTAVHGLGPDEARGRAEELLDRLHLKGHSHKRPAELSGGQRQRVAIARAVAIRPKLLLFDDGNPQRLRLLNLRSGALPHHQHGYCFCDTVTHVSPERNNTGLGLLSAHRRQGARQHHHLICERSIAQPLSISPLLNRNGVNTVC
jgi:ABC-type lipoprotein export system ATPase subunit